MYHQVTSSHGKSTFRNVPPVAETYSFTPASPDGGVSSLNNPGSLSFSTNFYRPNELSISSVNSNGKCMNSFKATHGIGALYNANGNIHQGVPLELYSQLK